MCNRCKPLVECDAQHKAATTIVEQIEFTDYFGEIWVGEEVTMMVNHDEHTLEPYAFIGGGAAHRKNVPSVSYGNNFFYIHYCPFCGEKLY